MHLVGLKIINIFNRGVYKSWRHFLQFPLCGQRCPTRISSGVTLVYFDYQQSLLRIIKNLLPFVFVLMILWRKLLHPHFISHFVTWNNFLVWFGSLCVILNWMLKQNKCLIFHLLTDFVSECRHLAKLTDVLLSLNSHIKQLVKNTNRTFVL